MKLTYQNESCPLHLSKKCAAYGCRQMHQQLLPSDIELARRMHPEFFEDPKVEPNQTNG